ncbi:MAG: carbohydrate-binding protein [Planctomycetota bacterium]
MRHLHLSLIVSALALASLLGGGESLQQGATVSVGGGTGTIKLLKSIPVVSSTFSERMIWQQDDPRLRALRDDLRLDEMVRAGSTEFDRQLLLAKYVARLWEYGDPRLHREEASAVKIVEYQKGEERFYCEQYACVLNGTAAAMGWVCRMVSHNGHTWNEMWSNQYEKWVYIDANNAHYVTGPEGTPMTNAELREDYYRNGGKNSTYRLVSDKSKKSKNAEFDTRMDVIGYHPNTNLIDQRFDYDKMFIIHDEFSKQAKIRGKGEPVKDPLKDPYFPINQAALTLQQSAAGLAVSVKTMTPNFKTFRARVDNGSWRSVKAEFDWKLHGGANVLEVKSVNAWEVDGPVSRVEVDMKAGGSATNDDLGTPAAEETTKEAGMAALKKFPDTPGELKPTETKEKLKSEWIGRWNTKGHWIEYTVDAPSAGTYTATMFYSSSYYPQRAITVNGQAIPELSAVTFAYTGGWGTYGYWGKADLPVQVELKAGKNTIRLTSLDTTSFWMKLLRFSANGTKPIDVSSLAITAEGGGKVQKTFSKRNEDILLFSPKGHWVDWNVEAPAGDYEVILAQGSLVPSVRQVRVNGELITPTNEFKVDTTGGWTVFTEVPTGRARLKEGKNVVRLENVSDECPNITYLKFVSSTGKEIIVEAKAFAADGGDGKKVELRSEAVKKK